MIVNVKFADATEKEVVVYFGSPQDPAQWSNLGEIDTSDPRWSAFYEAQSPSTQASLPNPTSA
jgi:hypothetical protein